MPSYTAPVRDIQFILHELLKIERYQGVLAGFDEDELAHLVEQAG